MKFDFVVEPLGKKHDRQDFDCGEETLNIFLRNYARQNSEKGLGRTFVAVRSDQKEVCGYYTLSAGSVSFETVPENLPRYPVPTVHLGRLAIDEREKGQGLGAFLLIDALRRCQLAAEELGIFAVEVFALNIAAKRFYEEIHFDYSFCHHARHLVVRRQRFPVL